MNTLNNISIKSILLITILVLGGLVVTTLVYSIFTIYLPQYNKAEGLTTANKMADLIIAATAEEAKERGFTAGYISSGKKGKPVDSSIRGKIDRARQQGDEDVKQAFVLAEKLDATNWGGNEFSTALQLSKKNWDKLQNARKRVDNQNITASEWLNQITDFIIAFSNLRQFAFVPSSHMEGAIYNNSTIKHAMWAITEYAGRERAILAEAIAASAALSAEKMNMLSNYRGIVDFQMEYLKNFAVVLLTNKKHKKFAPEVKEDWQEIQDNFLGSYQQLREQVYQAAKTGDYPVTSSEWLSKSNSAINGILELSRQVSLDSSLHSDKFGFNAEFSLLKALLIVIMAIIVGLVGLVLIKTVISRISRLRDTFIKVIDTKDITLRVDDSGSNEISQLSSSFNTMIQRMEELITHIRHSSDSISGNVEKSIQDSHSTDQGIAKQEADIEQLATAMNEMVASIQSISETTTNTAENSAKINEDVNKSGEVMRATATSIHDLGIKIEDASTVIEQLAKDSLEIGDVLGVIKEIAEQTNLLALNAAIEAARAGEQGRGFAVVADEVRTLAGRTHESTIQIQDMIERLQSQSQKATDVMQSSQEQSQSAITHVTSADETLSRVIESMSKILQMNDHIASSTEQQGSVADEINKNVLSLQTVAQDNRSLSQNTEDSLVLISEEMKRLVELVRQYNSSSA